MKTTTKNRIETFVDWFIRTDYVANWTAEKDADFVNEPDRYGRCTEAAGEGADGKTHAEVIEDWRESFSNWVRYGRQQSHGDYPRFEAAVNAHFDRVEEWHEKNGSLF